jgi:hypothetical protein
MSASRRKKPLYAKHYRATANLISDKVLYVDVVSSHTSYLGSPMFKYRAKGKLTQNPRDFPQPMDIN